MSEYKAGDIVVSLKDQKSSDRTSPFHIAEGYVAEVSKFSTDPKAIFFNCTPPGSGCYNSEGFRIATKDEETQYIKGKKIVEPPCPFEEGDSLVATDNITSKDTGEVITKDTVVVIDMLVKTNSNKTTVAWFEDYKGAFQIEGFKLA